MQSKFRFMLACLSVTIFVAACGGEKSGQDAGSDADAGVDAGGDDGGGDPSDAGAEDGDGGDEQAGDGGDGNGDGYDGGDDGGDEGGDPGPTEIQIRRLCDSSISCFWPDVRTNHLGDVLLVWRHEPEVDTTYFLQYQFHDGTDWSAPARVDDTLNKSSFPRLATDAAGNFHMTWHEGTGAQRDVRYKKFRHNTPEWLGTQLVSKGSNQNSAWPAIDVEDDGTPSVAWNEWVEGTIAHEIWFSRKASGSPWPDQPLNISGAPTTDDHLRHHPGLCVQGENVHVSWMDGEGTPDGRALYFTERIGLNGSFDTPAVLFGAAWYPYMDSDDQNQLHMMFWTQANGQRAFYWRRRANGNWQQVTASTQTALKSFTQVYIAPDGSMHGVWNQRAADDSYPVYYAIGDPATGQWGQPVQISRPQDCHAAEACGLPRVAVTPSGVAHIVWVDETGHEEGMAYHARVPAGTASPP